jgi:hypothetical protein
MFELGVEGDTLVGWRCWCTFGGAQANWISYNSQGASGRCALSPCLEGRLRLARFFLGNSGMGSDRATAAAAKAWTCGSDKLRDKIRRGGTAWLTDSDGDEWGSMAKRLLSWVLPRLRLWGLEGEHRLG